MKTIAKTLYVAASLTLALSPAFADLPNPGMEIDQGRTVLVVTDPQSEYGLEHRGGHRGHACRLSGDPRLSPGAIPPRGAAGHHLAYQRSS